MVEGSTDTCAGAGRLAGRVVLVVGGTGGIGGAATEAALVEGADVAATAPSAADVVAAHAAWGDAPLLIAADARDPGSADEAVAHTVARFGRLDALLHVAGGSGRAVGDGPLDALTDAGWSETLRLNLDTVFQSNRAAVRQFRAQGTGGAIVNTGSVLAVSPAPRHFATHAYAAAKAAIEGFTKSIAAYYAAGDIRANVLRAGLVETPMSARAMGDPAIRRFTAAKQPLDGGRAAAAADVAAAAVFLLSDEARFMTGQCIGVDGGWSCSDAHGVNDE